MCSAPSVLVAHARHCHLFVDLYRADVLLCTGTMAGLCDSTQLKEYNLFLQSLGITDREKVSFLSPLLRDLYRTAAKLDKYLEPHGAAFHSAISRLLTTDNPTDVPTHCWIRVVDRLGFFTDHDAHAQRIVNIGLSFAYRHKQVDALAGINALALDQAKSAPAQGLKNDVPHGGVLLAVGKGADAGGSGARGASADEAVPVGGTVLAARGAPNSATGAGASAGERDGGATQSPPAGGTVVANHRDLAHLPPPAQALRVPGGTGGGIVETLLLAGGSVVAKHGLTKASPTDQDQDDSDGGSEDAQGVGLAENVHEIQPTITPTSTAVDCVTFVLRTVRDRKDAIDVLRQLLADSLLCLVRKRRQEGFKFKDKTKNGRPRTEWTDVNDVTDRWWATWVARRDSISCLPEVGTVAAVANPTRRALTSRWCLIVKMDSINEIVKQLRCQSRYFSKTTLPPTETVVKLVSKKKLRLTVVIACMLVLASKEPGYDDMLKGLASTGRAAKEQPAGLTDATRHEFLAPGLAPVPAPSTAGRPSAQIPANHEDPAATAKPAVASMEARYAAMDAQLAQEETAAATDRRAHRLSVRRAAGRTAGTSPAGTTPSGGTPRGAARRVLLPPSSSVTKTPRALVGQALPDANPGRPLQVTPIDELEAHASTPTQVGSAVDGLATPLFRTASAAARAGAQPNGSFVSPSLLHGRAEVHLPSPSPVISDMATSEFHPSQPRPLVPVVPPPNYSLPNTQYTIDGGGAAWGGGAGGDGMGEKVLEGHCMDIDDFGVVGHVPGGVNAVPWMNGGGDSGGGPSMSQVISHKTREMPESGK